MNRRELIYLIVCFCALEMVLGQTPTTPTMQSFKPHSFDERVKEQSNQSVDYQPALKGSTAKEVLNSPRPYSEPDLILTELSRNNRTLSLNSNIPSKQNQSTLYVESILNEAGNINLNVPTIDRLPRVGISENVKYFNEGFNEIVDMLEGRKKLDLARAIFLTENAWFGGQMKYEDFSKMLNNDAFLISSKLDQENLPLNDVQAINYMVHKYISDTLEIQLASQERKVKTFPKRYDFEDPYGKENTSKLFVSKLMYENSGQCKSLPLYFLALVEKLGGEAYLSFSPSHSYIQCKDKRGNLFNIELTNGMLTSDHWVVGSGYVKSEAVKSGIYLDTLNKRQVIANCLVDLSKYYRWKYGKPNQQMGYDEFSLKCIDQALKYHSTNIHAILQKSNYYSVLLNYIAYQKGYRTEQDLQKNSITKELFIQRNKLYALTDGMGYEEMPEEVYKDWLRTLNEKAQQQEHEKQLINFSKISTY